MNILDAFTVASAVLLSVGGAAVILLALSKWLGGVWAARILEGDRAIAAREQELLIRRRNVYAKLALTMRVFLSSTPPATPEEKRAFLAAYDEAALWAAEEVIAEVAKFLDMQIQVASQRESISNQSLVAAYAHCITVMRRDCGFAETQYAHRVVAF
jgi:hypothetical protein